ncbi:MAG: CorA family divalent cation transporter, partial [Candidatus Omnitrophica bacterium]|nr:CorA family divalent cation transporter [Candidatus Omnitrophota bacterium]
SEELQKTYIDESKALNKDMEDMATFFLPITVITSFYGMNFKLPEFTLGPINAHAYVFILNALIVLIMFLYMKWKKWI